MKNNIDITEAQVALVKEILSKNLTEGINVWVFGSRATFKTKPSSDLDIALEALNQQPISLELLYKLQDEFEFSELPWKVDVIDLNAVDQNFRKIIDREKVLFNYD